MVNKVLLFKYDLILKVTQYTCLNFLINETISDVAEDPTFKAKAKAKDPKTFRGQGQACRGQYSSRPRTDRLEAKAKDQGQQCFQKKEKKGHRWCGRVVLA